MGNTNKAVAVTSEQLQSWQFVQMSGEQISFARTQDSIAEVRDAIARTQQQYPLCSIKLINADGVIIEDFGPMPDIGAEVTVIVKDETNFSGRWQSEVGTQWEVIIDDSSYCLKAAKTAGQDPKHASWRTTKQLKTVGDSVDGKMCAGDAIQAFFEKSCRMTAQSENTILLEWYYYSKEGPSMFETINALKKHKGTAIFTRATAPPF